MDLQWEKFSQGMQLYLWCFIIVFFPLYLSKAFMYIFSTWICSFYLPCFTIFLLSVQRQFNLAEFVCLTIEKCFQGMLFYLWCFIIISLSVIVVERIHVYIYHSDVSLPSLMHHYMFAFSAMTIHFGWLFVPHKSFQIKDLGT